MFLSEGEQNNIHAISKNTYNALLEFSSLLTTDCTQLMICRGDGETQGWCQI